MPSVVVDASAIAAIAFEEPEADEVARRLRGSHLLAPTLLSYELASICVKKICRTPDSADILRANLRDALEAVHDLRPVDPQDAVRVALQHGLTTYDAPYLWLARFHGVELLTLDAKLDRAARAH